MSILQAILTKIETQNRQPNFAENYSVLSMSATSGEICPKDWSFRVRFNLLLGGGVVEDN